MSQLHEYGVLMPKFAAWAKKMPDARASSRGGAGHRQELWGSEIAADLSTYEARL